MTSRTGLLRRVAALLAGLSMGCATISNGPLQRVRVESEPPEAAVRLSNCGPGSSPSSRTPDSVWVNRRATRCQLTFSAPGYADHIVQLQRKVSSRMGEYLELPAELCDANCNTFDEMAIDLILSGVVGVIGLGVDASTGAMFQQTPAHILVNFDRPDRPDVDDQNE
jgi:hypothetical protein